MRWEGEGEVGAGEGRWREEGEAKGSARNADATQKGTWMVGEGSARVTESRMSGDDEGGVEEVRRRRW